MINKLLDNCFLTELNTIVTDVEEDNHLYWYAFKETVFFMKQGGMEGDIGVINGYEVLDVKIKDNKQWHLMAEEMQVGDAAFMSINLHERFRKCQIHTAQHLISALLCNVYKVDTLSHHVSDDENDIEFNLESFTDKMKNELMVLCNGLIRDDLEVTVLYPSRSEAALHAPAEKLNHEELRVVRIGALDYNLCGCMHVPSLRYLQMIYISGYEKTPRGYKIKYICGDQLLDSVSRRYKVLNEASQTLALSHLYLNTGINKLINEQKALSRDIVLWKQKYFVLLAEKLNKSDCTCVTYEFDDIDVKSLVQLAQYLTTEYQKPCVLLAKLYDKCHLVVGAPKDSHIDCSTCFKGIAQQFELNGGGSRTLSQGGGAYTKSLSDYVKAIQKL
ncbi:hypothetical protein D5266_08040 [bacterium c-19]|nr:hypothetical protein [bacterium c-19]